MPGNDQTMYKKARKTTHFTQEEAAEALGLSVESLKAYEQGNRTPPNSAVERMARLYDAPWLRLTHLLEISRDLDVLPEEIPLGDLPASVLALFNRNAQLSGSFHQLLLIAEDGVVDDLEQPDFQRISAHILALVAAGLQVLYATGPDIKENRLKAGTFKRSGSGLRPKTIAELLYHNSAKAQAPIFPGEEVTSP